LQELDCSYNQLNKLDLSGNKEITTIDCSYNLLKELDLSQNLSLKNLDARNNNLFELENRDLSIFSHLVNLRSLLISNDEKEKIEKKIYNRFCGSLEPLKNLSKLEEINVSNTDIDSGFEYLPDSLEELYCSSEERLESKVRKLEEELKSKGIEGSDGYYNLQE
jgi:Leucine-rich repeat (LRR) protein